MTRGCDRRLTNNHLNTLWRNGHNLQIKLPTEYGLQMRTQVTNHGVFTQKELSHERNGVLMLRAAGCLEEASKAILTQQALSLDSFL